METEWHAWRLLVDDRSHRGVVGVLHSLTPEDGALLDELDERERDQSYTWVPAGVAWSWADELDELILPVRKAGQAAITTPWDRVTHEVSPQVIVWLSQEVRRMARVSGAEQLESPNERDQRLRVARARKRLAGFRPDTDPVSAVVAALSDEWVWFEEIRARVGVHPLTAKETRSALAKARNAGYVMSAPDQVYRGKTRYATSAEGEAWISGGPVEQHITTPGAEPGIDEEAHRRAREQRERALAENDARDGIVI